MIYKKATEQLRNAGIHHVVITRKAGGASPEDTRAQKQRSEVFDTWQEAVQAVKAGYRPEILALHRVPENP